MADQPSVVAKGDVVGHDGAESDMTSGMAADSEAEIGFLASLPKNNIRPPVWKPPPPGDKKAGPRL